MAILSQEQDASVLRTILGQAGSYPLFLIGSYNLQLQGVQVPAADIDILTSDAGVKHFAKLYNEAIINERGFLEFWTTIQDIEVNFTSYDNNPLHPEPLAENVVRVSLGNLALPGLSSASEHVFYRSSGREKDIAKLALIEESPHFKK